MMSRIRYAALGCLLILSTAQPSFAGSVYDYTLPSINGGTLNLAAFKGQAVLVVNTASQCGFTPQYDGLQSLWETYKDRGLVVLGVPSNDFGGQEPGSRAEIKEFCSVNFDVDFPMSDKVVVRGDNAHPLYQWLAATLGASSRPRWNFYKYLIDANGQPVAYFSSMTRPQSSKITKAVEAALPR
ncbi:MAG: glutathione peroxidase [Rhizobiales bacterium TMED83]|nr:glutathione peroxidase [Rhodobiaceae bacterium]RPF94793.1 MAG: glutathione peroxidase [Rhizobiales bacterium TMED83]|tara:strand:+ start:1034 stop:1585 length:552 start_codon:yes stop_codon:yes gene_type:complete